MEKLLALHPAGKTPTNVNAEKYWAVRNIILDTLPPVPPGMTLAEMDDIVGSRVPAGMFAKGTAWWTTTVKLDLEARGMIERTGNKSPICHIRLTGSDSPATSEGTP